MEPSFSEFTYGYALIDSLQKASPSGFRTAPILPSLRSEGKKGVGYDVKIRVTGRPLLLQFKIPMIVERNKLAPPPGFKTPFYRMYLARADRSKQHKSLLHLGSRHKFVYYVTPRFHSTRDLHALFRAGNVASCSAWIRPSTVGPITDSHAHFVAYESHGNVGFFYSGNGKRVEPIDWEAFERALAPEPQLRDANVRAAQPILSFAEDVIALCEGATVPIPMDLPLNSDEGKIARAAWLVRIYLDSELLALWRSSRRESNGQS